MLEFLSHSWIDNPNFLYSYWPDQLDTCSFLNQHQSAKGCFKTQDCSASVTKFYKEVASNKRTRYFSNLLLATSKRQDCLGIVFSFLDFLCVFFSRSPLCFLFSGNQDCSTSWSSRACPSNLSGKDINHFPAPPDVFWTLSSWTGWDGSICYPPNLSHVVMNSPTLVDVERRYSWRRCKM